MEKEIVFEEQEKAEAYVRSKCPELMELSFGCRVKVKNEDTFFTAINKPYGSLHWDFVKVAERKEVDNGINVLGLEIIGHPIQLQHWLRVAGEHCGVTKVGIDAYGDMIIRPRYENRADGDKCIRFNLTTGQPATEEDYQAFNQIVGNI